jgi:hypothetical protein
MRSLIRKTGEIARSVAGLYLELARSALGLIPTWRYDPLDGSV